MLALSGEREYLTCEGCGAHRAVEPEQLDGVRQLIGQQFGYRASFTHFPIVGLCGACQSGASATRSPEGD
jgi:Fur family transcriptional regulator, ferric uptake regulator